MAYLGLLAREQKRQRDDRDHREAKLERELLQCVYMVRQQVASPR